MSDATPTLDIFADNPTCHEELDRLVNKDMDTLNPPEGWKYIFLFQLIVQHSNDRLNREYTIAINAKKGAGCRSQPGGFASRCMKIKILSTDQKSG